jgi:hypothetical protein
MAEQYHNDSRQTLAEPIIEWHGCRTGPSATEVCGSLSAAQKQPSVRMYMLLQQQHQNTMVSLLTTTHHHQLTTSVFQALERLSSEQEKSG